MKLLLFVGLIVGSVGLSFIGSQNSYAQSSGSTYLAPTMLLAIDTPPASKEETPASTCRIEGIGWILCPVATVMGQLVDGAYAFVSSLLVVQPLMATGTGANVNVYNAWTIMRNFANIAFVIAFLIIIFSQMTSVGLNNYGIKKMLPRLIIAAILVNASFWICAIAIDISNILGSSMNGLFQGMTVNDANCNISPSSGKENCVSITTGTGTAESTGVGFAGIVGLALAGTGMTLLVLHATFAALFPVLLAAIIAIVTVFLVLTLRQALIILLVVVSPLAFVAYLLPNTESLYKKWLGLFKTLLLMYPIIAMLFGASALASIIVMQSVSEDNPYRVPIQIMGAAIAIIPLALTPIVMKTAGGVLSRFGGMINNPNKGPVDRLRKKADAYKDRRQDIAQTRRLGGTNMFRESGKRLGSSNNRFARGAGKVIGAVDNVPGVSKASNSVASKLAVGALNTEARNENAKRALTEGKQDFIANNASTDAEYAQSLAGPTGNAVKLQASALEAVEKRKHDEIKAGETLVKLHPDFNPDQSHLPDDQKQSNAEIALVRALKDNNETLAQAAQNIMVSQMGTSGVDKFKKLIANGEASGDIDINSSISSALRNNIAENHTGMKGSSADLDSWAHSDGTELKTHTNNAGLWAGLSDAHIASQTPGSIKAAGESGGLDAVRAESIISNDRLNTTIKGAQKAEFNDIINRAGGPTTTQTTNQTINVQNTPGVLNVTHNPTPANSRTSAPANNNNYSGNNVSPGGIILPDNDRRPPQPPTAP
ncbi:MAG: rane protein of unknown function [Candidatus Saccharibacteria bacterium]|nr:rane protein of unknown function [Candidatus Saccharibacteria bacterium]